MLSWFVRKNKGKSCFVDEFDIFCLPFEFFTPWLHFNDSKYFRSKYKLYMQKGGLKFWLININVVSYTLFGIY